MWYVVALLLLSAQQSLGWVSGGDRSDPTVLANNKLNLPRETAWLPLRIGFDFPESFPDAGSVSMKSYPDINQMTDSVKTFFKNSLNINRVNQEIVETSSINCGNGINLVGNTYAEVDVIIVVRGYNGGATSETGFSQVCHLQEGGLENVVLGIISINIDAFNAEPDYFRKWTFIAHLTVHVLGFSDKLYEYWGTPSGKIGRNNIIHDISVRGLNKKGIVTPKALAIAKSVYAYSDMKGIELEEIEASPGRYEHWDARILFNDVSCARSYNEMIISSVTLALLEDSGWYQVSGCHGQSPIFGRGQGCKFVEEKCINSARNSNSQNLWCSKSKSSSCDPFHLRKGSCTVQSNLNPAIQSPEMRYFGTNNAGGSDKFTDYCPYTIPIEGGNCRSTTSTPAAGQTFGATSRCLEHSINLAGTLDPSVYLPFSAGCFDVSCSGSGDYQFIISGTPPATITCPQAGGNIYVNTLLSSKKIQGWVNCPPRNEVCGDVPCTNACNGQGCCVNGVCQCFDGFAGPDCGITCPAYCNICPDGKCIDCQPGYYVDGDKCTKCKTGCQTCTNGSSCTTLTPGYTQNITPGGDTEVVPECLEHCHDCTEPYTCGTPDDGYCLDSTQLGVDTCCSGCDICLPNDCCYCTKCKFGLMLTSINTCTGQCVVNCLVCKNTIECATCKKGYNLTQDGRCVRCPIGCATCYNMCPSDSCSVDDVVIVASGCSIQSNCDTTCFDCAQVKCTACASGYTMNSSGVCDKICPINCLTCDTSTSPPVCTKCNAGFYLDTSLETPLCTPCEADCLRCSKVSDTTTSCTSCRAGFFLRAQATDSVPEYDCVDCETGCSYCTDELSCGSCVIRFYLDTSDNHCYRCEYGCRTCDKDGCNVADPGFYLEGDGHVIRCHKSCATCDSDLICNTCLPGFFFYECSSTNCLCRDCEPSCARCSSPTECIVCRSWYFLDVDNKCTICDPLCASCEEAGKCLSCKWGYFLKPDMTCEKCMTGCQSCVDYDHCKICLGGYWPNEYVCELCPTNCLLCWTPSDCYSCRLGWWLDKESFLVPTCVRCDPLCIRCGSLTDCQVCKRTYYVVNGICEKCGPNCAFCQSNSECTICELGYFLDTDNTCKPCQNGCLDCCDAITCMRARSSWWLDYFPGLYTNRNAGTAIGPYIIPSDLGGYVATPCSYKCLNCLTLNDCGTCHKTSYLSDDKTHCIDCVAPCIECASATRCFKCAAKHYLDSNGECVACKDNCNACSDVMCTQPKSGFYMVQTQQTTVAPCLAPCNTCVGTGTNDCITCRTGSGKVLETATVYSSTITTYRCDPCDTGCRSCNPRNVCLVANNPYYINPDGTVSKCPDTCTACKLTDGIVLCTSCIAKYGLESGYCIPCSDVNCYRCGPRDVCLICYGGWYLNSESTCSRCVSPCGQCLDESTCKTCVAGYYLPDPTVPGPCSLCISNCNKCTDNVSCDVCKNGFYYDESLKVCTVCPNLCTACSQILDDQGATVVKCSACLSKSTIEGNLCVPCDDPNCLTCSPKSVCSKCNNGYYLDGEACTKCVAPCGLCTSDTFCKTCTGATYLQSADTGTCASCITNCNRCLDGVSCVTCRAAYYYDLNLQACTPCPNLCTACYQDPNTFEVKCTKCASKSTLQSDLCVPCSDQFCLTCSPYNTCSVCANGYYLDGVVCSKCSAPCGLCTSPTFCKSCVGATYLSSAATGSCASCMANCNRCLDGVSCVTCKAAYYYDTTRQLCSACPNLCTACYQDSNTLEVKCTACAGKAALENDLCVACVDPYCLTCNPSTVCSKCANGYFLNGNSCTKCSAPCGLCTSPTFCKSCVGANYLSSADQGTCSNCVSNCNRCLDGESCVTCRAGYYFDYSLKVCAACPNLCTVCAQDPNTLSVWCSTCAAKGALEGNVCVPCVDPYCLACNPSAVCSKCANGYYLEEGVCKKCVAPCGYCTSLTFCTTCVGATYLSDAATGTCSNCLANCNRCTNGSSCTSIKSGYYMSSPTQSPVINACPSACSACSETVSGDASSVVCSACKNANYILNNGKCCINSCTVCDNSLTCAQCVSGWSLNSAKLCFQCSLNCVSCASTTKCTTCITGYYVYSGLCCPNSCSSCNNQVCWTCKPTFYLQNGACVTCPAGCSSCLNGVCQGCKPGYYISGTNCNPCSFSSCATCDSATYCSTCISGFTKTDDGRCIVGNGECPATCKECSLYRCYNCKTNYFFSYDSCIDCPAGCDKCDLDVCQSCKTGYYLSYTNCRQCPTNCVSCYSALTCSGCADGYDLSEYGNCVSKDKCGLGCKTCRADNTCAACLPGYFMTNVGCFACAEGCNDCTGLWGCNGCSSGYNYLAGNCCPTGCSSCNPGPNSCYTCENGYYLENGVCGPCRVGCSGCSNGVCSGCIDGYFISGTLCRKCPVGCQTCWSESGCNNDCSPGYTYLGTMCVPAP